MKRLLIFCLLSCSIYAAQYCESLSGQPALLFIMNAFFFMHKVDCSSLKIKYPHQLTYADYHNNCIMNFSLQNHASTQISALIPCSPLSILHKHVDLFVYFDAKAQAAHIVLANQNQLPQVKDLLAMVNK